MTSWSPPLESGGCLTTAYPVEIIFAGNGTIVSNVNISAGNLSCTAAVPMGATYQVRLENTLVPPIRLLRRQLSGRSDSVQRELGALRPFGDLSRSAASLQLSVFLVKCILKMFFFQFTALHLFSFAFLRALPPPVLERHVSGTGTFRVSSRAALRPQIRLGKACGLSGPTRCLCRLQIQLRHRQCLRVRYIPSFR